MHRAVAAEWAHDHPRPAATLSQVVDHLEHARTVAGIDHVGIGADFDGTDAVPVDLSDVSRYPALVAELLDRGWSEDDCAKVAGSNVLRLLRDAEAVAARLALERPPSLARMEDLDGSRSC